jgi:hypothetical protein
MIENKCRSRSKDYSKGSPIYNALYICLKQLLCTLYIVTNECAPRLANTTIDDPK